MSTQVEIEALRDYELLKLSTLPMPNRAWEAADVAQVRSVASELLHLRSKYRNLVAKNNPNLSVVKRMYG